MKQELAELAAGSFDWQWIFMTMLAALGISTIDGAEFVGGMVMALLGAMLAWKLGGHQDKRRWGLVLITGFVMAYVAALVHVPFWGWVGIQGVPVQASMLVAGFASKWAAGFFFDFFQRLGTKGKATADRIAPGGDE